MTENRKQTYDFICFTDLAYEFNFSEGKETESKIKRRLKYYNLGEYDQSKVDYIRKLKNELFLEISKNTESKYFYESKNNYADLADFNFNQMMIDFKKRYSLINKNDLIAMINFAIYLYYLK